MNPLIVSAIPGLIEIGKELIEDKDKAVEFQHRALDAQLQLLSKLAEQQTIPWVDGLVKLLTALVALVRPLASVGVFLYGLFHPELLQQLHALGTPGDLAIGAIFGAAPAWGLSRHREKIQRASVGPSLVHPDKRLGL